jgi:hypothetical protein
MNHTPNTTPAPPAQIRLGEPATVPGWQPDLMSPTPESDDDLEAVLEGGPAGLPPALRACQVARADERIKVPYLGGYEHFEKDGAAGVDDMPVVFRWTGRTRIAE